VCVIGSKALIASETDESEPNHVIGEWTSDVFKTSTSDSFTVCFILGVKHGEFAKRIHGEVIYKDVSNDVHTASLFDYDVRTTDTRTQGSYGTFEFHLSNVTEYQVWQSCFIIYSVYPFGL